MILSMLRRSGCRNVCGGYEIEFLLYSENNFTSIFTIKTRQVIMIGGGLHEYREITFR